MKNHLLTLFRPFSYRIAGCILVVFSLVPSLLKGQLYFEAASEGLEGATILCFEEATDGSIVAGTDQGIWRREAGGDRWEWTGFSKMVFSIKRLASGRLLGSASNGVHYSDDNGRTWTKQLNVPGMNAIVQNDEGMIVAADREGTPGGSTYFYHSSDDGANWDIIPLDYEKLGSDGLVWIDNVLLASSYVGVLKSIDNGNTWQPTGLTEKVTGLIRTTGGSLVAVGGTMSNLLYGSDDNGTTWHLIDSVSGTSYPTARRIEGIGAGAEGEYYVIEVGDSFKDSLGRNGIWRREPGSSDETKVFSTVGVRGFNFTLDNPWIGADFGAFRNENGEWIERSRGLHAFTQAPISSDSQGRLFAMIPDNQFRLGTVPFTTNALYRSTDNGESWERLSGEFSSTVTVDGFDNLYTTRDTIILVDNGQGGEYERLQSRTIISNDGGITWKLFHPLYTISDLVTGDGDVVAATVVQNEGSISYWISDLAISHDRGQTWKMMTDEGMPWESGEAPTPTAVEILSDGYILVSAGGSTQPGPGGGIFRIAPDYSVEKLIDSIVMSDLLSLGDGTVIGTVYSTMDTQRGIYRSEDRGESWERYDPGLHNSLYFSKLGENYLQILNTASVKPRALVSSDNGETWLLAETWYKSVVMQGKDTLYGIGTNGIFRSDGNPVVWSPVTVGGLPEVPTFLATNGSGFLFAGTANYGLYRTLAPTGSVEERNETLSDLRLMISADRTDIDLFYSLHSPAMTRVSVLDLLGRTVISGEEIREESGDHRRHLFVGDLPRGTYIVMLSHGRERRSVVLPLH